MPTVAGGTAASEWAIGAALTKGRITAQSLATGASYIADVDTVGDNELSVTAEMTGAANGDLTVSVIPFKGDNVTPMTGVTLTPISSNGPTFASPNVSFNGLYDVSGYPKVRIAIKNNNAGTQTLNELSWRLSGG